MRKSIQVLFFSLFITAVIGTISILYLTQTLTFDMIKAKLFLWLGFALTFGIMINEGIVWVKNGKRSEWSDLVIIAFLFLTVYLFTEDVFNSFIGAFSIYLLLGIFELKDYEVLNKILMITVITYNFIFFAGLIGNALDQPVIQDTAFSMSFWLMLILGFAFFGRKYIIVWRFMSSQYLTLGLYIIAWLAVVSVSKFTSLNIMENIYEVLIIANVFIYAITGPILDLMLGMKPTKDEHILKIVAEVAQKLGMDPQKIKVRFGQYPIINAMAYGAFWDMRVGIIAPDINRIPDDELKGIVAHELAHLKGKHTLTLSLISTMELVFRKLLDWPATYYDYVFAPEDQPYPMWVFIVINIILYIFIYIFVRMLESQADLQTKRIGLGVELAKGLYNLESFYSYGREIGLNTMLLCDEKITEENRLQDYLSTAEYLDKMVIHPTKGALLSNFMNSHPPSYHRIMAMLSEKDITIGREAVMPFTFLRQRNARSFFYETKDARAKFREIATNKIKSEFKIDNIPKLMEKINRKARYDDEIGQKFVFMNIDSFERTIGTIDDVVFHDEAGEMVFLKITTNMGYKQEINPAITKYMPYHQDQIYLLPKEGPHKLANIDLDKFESKDKIDTKTLDHDLESHKKQGIFEFEPVVPSQVNEKKKVWKSIFNTKLPQPLIKFQNFVNKQVLIKSNGKIQLKSLTQFQFDEVNKNIVVKFDMEEKSIQLQEFILNFGETVVPIHYDTQTWESETKIIQYLYENKYRIVAFLKKAVNNEEEGKIQEIKFDENHMKIKQLVIKNNFGQIKELDIAKVDFVLVEEKMLVFEPKHEMSAFSKWITKIRAKYNPDQIVF